MIAYADEVKRDLLGVPAELLAEHGAVSAETRQGDGRGRAARRPGPRSASRSRAWRGRAGAASAKPVGLVYLHVSAPGRERGQELHLPGDRAQVREWAAVAALQLVRTTLS